MNRNIQFPDDFYKRIEECAKERGMKISQYIKMCISEQILKDEQKKRES